MESSKDLIDYVIGEEDTDYTDLEKDYISRLKAMYSVCVEDISDKRDKLLFTEYREFITNILKYRNLKLEENGTRAKRLIKCKKYLDLKLLERDNYNIIKFSGIYLVADVIFLDRRICDMYYNNPAKYATNSSLGLPDDICLRSMHLISDRNNNYMAVALIKGDISEKYLTNYNSWEFPIFK